MVPIATASEKITKSARLELRLPTAQKTLIEDAASLQGVSVSDFLAAAAHGAAVKVIQEHAAVTLSREESARFVQALLTPPAPTAALQHLMRDPT